MLVENFEILQESLRALVSRGGNYGIGSKPAFYDMSGLENNSRCKSKRVDVFFM